MPDRRHSNTARSGRTGRWLQTTVGRSMVSSSTARSSASSRCSWTRSRRTVAPRRSARRTSPHKGAACRCSGACSSTPAARCRTPPGVARATSLDGALLGQWSHRLAVGPLRPLDGGCVSQQEQRRRGDGGSDEGGDTPLSRAWVSRRSASPTASQTSSSTSSPAENAPSPASAPARTSTALPWGDPRRGSAAWGAVGQGGAATPVSSSTSRTAAVSTCSPSVSLPFGSDQSSYFGRWMSAISRPSDGVTRQSTAPAATDVRLADWLAAHGSGARGTTARPALGRDEVVLHVEQRVSLAVVAVRLPAPVGDRATRRRCCRPCRDP